ncbi:hypothetical protein CEXT_814971 [Caerostris extrusa]|uniref:Uncharacterized protein n=1 Tax=Caerostris extrusa TaxID=172846 RepID=A0AAV4R3F2_CAEEX|nr:hypothetical protein CEXT_814971 [Caerostris extrusa]
MLILSPQNVSDIVDAFDKYDRYYRMDEFEVNYLYEFYFNGVVVEVKDNLKLLELPLSLGIEEETRKLEFILNGPKMEQNSNILDEDSKIEHLIDDLCIDEYEIIAGIKKMCSYCGKKCFKYLLFQLHKRNLWIEEEEQREL